MPPPTTSAPASQPARRSFLKNLATALLGVLATLPAAGAALLALLDPLRHRSKDGGFIRVASLNGLPEDGTPRQFPVVADHTDAWTRSPQVRVGAVYLRRTGSKTVHAINVVCPHAGCFVNYAASERHFHCPCHNSSFALDGAINDPSSPSPRPLDTLEVQVRQDSEIWVRFQNFRAGIAGKIPQT